MRVVRFFLGNLPLKIGAVLVAVILYGAMVVLQTTQQWPGTIAIDPVNGPTDGFLLDSAALPQVHGIKYIAAPDVPISQSSFQATIDLSNAKVSDTGESSLVRVVLKTGDSRIQIIDYQPQQISVTLDLIVHKAVPVQVNSGVVPSGLSPGTAVLSAASVDVSGPATFVRKVAYAEARVRIDASGLDVSQDVDLTARDASDATVDFLTLNPARVHVQIQVGSEIRSESVPVDPIVVGAQAAGYVITSVDVTPPIVSVHGQADALALLKGKAGTKPISISGATSDVSANVSLDLPTGVTSDATAPIVVVVHLQPQSSTRSLAIGVVPVGAHSDRVYTLSTLSVSVTLGGATAALNALDTSTLVANASVADLGVGTFTVQVTVTVPAGIKVVAVSPVTITVTVAAAPSPTPSASAP